MERVVRIDGLPLGASEVLPAESRDTATTKAAADQVALEEHLLNGLSASLGVDLRHLVKQAAEIRRLVHGLVDAVQERSSAGCSSGEGSAFDFENAEVDAGHESETVRLDRLLQPALPDPQVMRRILRQRQQRAHFFGAGLFADPAWDMLLDLTAASAENKRVSVTSLCIASEVPLTTALRWIRLLLDAGLVERSDDDTDRRRAFIALSVRGADIMARYFAEVGKSALYAF